MGRKLKPWEKIHHDSRDKLDNDPENLVVCRNQDEHEEIHEDDGDDYWNDEDEI